MKKYFILLICILCCACVSASDELSQQAVAFYSDNNYNKTLDLLLQIDENERTAQDWLLLGNLYNEKNEMANAVFMYQKSILKDKKSYKAYYNLANIYSAENKYALAVDNYKKAIRYNRTVPYIYYNLGCVYIKQGDLKKAKRAFIEALSIKKDIPELQYNMAYVCKQLNQPKDAQIYLDNYNKLVNVAD